LQAKFHVEEWIIPFVRAFLSQSHQKVLEWTRKAIQVDEVRWWRHGGWMCQPQRSAESWVLARMHNRFLAPQFKPVTEGAQYSSSVVDMFNALISVRRRRRGCSVL